MKTKVFLWDLRDVTLQRALRGRGLGGGRLQKSFIGMWL